MNLNFYLTIIKERTCQDKCPWGFGGLGTGEIRLWKCVKRQEFRNLPKQP